MWVSNGSRVVLEALLDEISHGLDVEDERLVQLAAEQETRQRHMHTNTEQKKKAQQNDT